MLVREQLLPARRETFKETAARFGIGFRGLNARSAFVAEDLSRIIWHRAHGRRTDRQWRCYTRRHASRSPNRRRSCTSGATARTSCC